MCEFDVRRKWHQRKIILMDQTLTSKSLLKIKTKQIFVNVTTIVLILFFFFLDRPSNDTSRWRRTNDYAWSHRAPLVRRETCPNENAVGNWSSSSIHSLARRFHQREMISSSVTDKRLNYSEENVSRTKKASRRVCDRSITTNRKKRKDRMTSTDSLHSLHV